jgi:acyl-CoA thioester hydrolase
MFIYDAKMRVRYGETDQMGYAYYGVYAMYYEQARTEAFAQMIGIRYKQLEEEGTMLPVRKMEIEYFKPAFYDDEITCRVIIKEIPRIKFTVHYETYNNEGELLNKGTVILVFVDKKTGKVCACPEIYGKRIAALDAFNKI